jgi:hypothetical protein
MICEYEQPRWNDTDKGERKNTEKNLSQFKVINNKFDMDRTGREPGPPR